MSPSETFKQLKDASAVFAVIHRMSVCLSQLGSSAKTAKHRIMQRTIHGSTRWLNKEAAAEEFLG